VITFSELIRKVRGKRFGRCHGVYKEELWRATGGDSVPAKIRNGHFMNTLE
jgi:hypothetical protein